MEHKAEVASKHIRKGSPRRACRDGDGEEKNKEDYMYRRRRGRKLWSGGGGGRSGCTGEDEEMKD